MTGDPYAIGSVLTSPRFGDGVVTDVQKGGKVAVVDFGGTIGVKRFVTALAPLTLVRGSELHTLTYDADRFDEDIRQEVYKANVRRAAQDALRAEVEGEGDPFDAGTLAELLARPAEPPMRVEGLIPSDASTLLSAQRKCGKTTLALNLARCLITGEDLLGRLTVQPIAGAVGFLNYEVSDAMVARWANEHGVDRERLFIVNLRGRRNPLASPDDRLRLAQLLRERQVEAVIVDTFSRAFTGQKRSDSGEVGAFLNDLDTYIRADVGARDLILTAHAGWNGERTRDSSALEDWPDSIIRLTRDADDESQRFLSAIGRDVEVDEDRLNYHAPTRTLTLAGVGSRKKAGADRKIADLAVLTLRAARQQPGASVAALEGLIRAMDDAPPFRNGEVSRAAKWAEGQGLMRIVPGGPGRRSEHHAVDDPTPPNPSPTSPGDLPQPLPPLLYRGGVGGGGSGALPIPDGSAS